QEAGAGVRELLAELVRRVERIGRRVDATQRGDGQEGDGVLRQVGTGDREDVALLEPAPGEARGRSPDVLGELLVGEGAAGRPVDQRRLVPEPGRVAEDVVGDGHVGNGHARTRALDDHLALLAGLLLGDNDLRAIRRLRTAPRADSALGDRYLRAI